RWNQNKVAAGIIDGASAQRDSEQVLMEPETMVCHETEEVLSGVGSPMASDAATVLATKVDCKCHSGFIDLRIRIIVILPLHAIVCVDTFTAGVIKRIRTPVVVRYDRHGSSRTP